MVPYVVMWYEIFASLQENVAVKHLVCEHKPNMCRVGHYVIYIPEAE